MLDIGPQELLERGNDLDNQERTNKHFTPQKFVDEMLAAMGEEIKDPNKKIFEPSCGEGIFVEAVIKLRMRYLRKKVSSNNRMISLAAAIDCIKNVYALDVNESYVRKTQENVEKLFLTLLSKRSFSQLEKNRIQKVGNFIISSNICVGDTLDQSKYDSIKFKDWVWLENFKLSYSQYNLSEIYQASKDDKVANFEDIGSVDLMEVVKCD